ncbi:MAG: nuclear transport factor 2 family protein, partial [Pseudomonadota bacterium]
MKHLRKLFPLLLSLQFAHAAEMPVGLTPPPTPTVDDKAVLVVPHPDQSVLLRNADAALLANKQLVYTMWRTVMSAGQVDKMSQFFATDLKQHNPVIATGLAAYQQWLQPQLQRSETIPATINEPLITMVAEGDKVGLAFVTEYPEPDGSGKTYTSTHFYLYRIEGGRIAEQWESVQVPKGMVPPAENAGGPLPVRGTQGLAQIAMLDSKLIDLANNKRLVFDTWRQIPEGGREELAELYLDPIYIQHNPNATTGRAGFKEYFTKRPDSSIETFLEDPIVAVVAEGDLVMQVLEEERPDLNKPGTLYKVAWFDLFRVANGRLIEHWDAAAKGELPAAMQQAAKAQ